MSKHPVYFIKLAQIFIGTAKQKEKNLRGRQR